MEIRKVVSSDVGRLAEIIVYNNRKNYYPIFGNVEYSFKIFTVENVAKEFLRDNSFMNNCYVYEDKVIKGFICVVNTELKKLYVDSFFQGEGIGSKLIEFAKKNLNAKYLWALEKNIKAIEFYKKHGFTLSGDRVYEEGTTEWLVLLER